MFRNVVKGLSSAIVIGIAFTTSLMAEGISGQAKGAFTYNQNKSGGTSYDYLDTVTEATIGYASTLQGEEWSTTGSIEITLNKDGVSQGDRYLSVENERISMGVGNWTADAFDITAGKDYIDLIDQSMAVGKSAFEGAGGNYLQLGLKNMGVNVTAGFNTLGNNTKVGDDGLYQETLLSARYRADFKAVQVALSCTLVAEKTDVAQNTGGTGSIHDGGSKNEIAVAALMPLGKIGIALNASQYSTTKGGSSGASTTTNTIVTTVDIPLGSETGISISLGNQSEGTTRTTSVDIGYQRALGSASLSAGFSTLSTSGNSTTTMLGAGLVYDF